MTDILIIEDNAEIGELLTDFLKTDGYSVNLQKNGEDGLNDYMAHGAKLIILDIMLPGMDGFAVCQKIRENSNTPIIILSARGEKEDKLSGLIIGADDYMEKPFDIDILLAKVNGIFKRRYQSDIIMCRDLKLDKVKHIVYKNDSPVSMTAKEFELLLFLMENSGRTLSKDLLFNRIWGFDSFSEPQTLTVHIKWLREKIEDDPKAPKHLLTVWGTGYRFEE